MRALWMCGLLALGCDDGGSAAPVDAAPADAAVPDAGLDAAPLDAQAPDAAILDATLDAAAPDAAVPDAAVPDAARPPPERPTGTPRFAFPVPEAARAQISKTPIFGVDHDPADGERVRCLDHAGRGFPWCYDGHDGSDFLLVGGFPAQDRGSAPVVAAAAGEVIRAEDGNYDHCHADPASGQVSCDGHPMRANQVRIRHADGWESWYFHLQRDSVAVAVGDVVTCGTLLGRIGSSGNSSLPHLHFEVLDPAGAVIDPFAGPESQPESLWVAQGPLGDLPASTCDPDWGYWLP
ncbi:MAG: M23 family metallopeptidase [Myxococcales bacterium]|nr:M23 family metallopeptidase [Myxococcales bacterium]